ncbi:hypothetical protein PAXRUDRAFT_772670 [Paxillus rubicundulus Ve08.2h10]|uniref:Alpha/beta hydrolase fold-3 domain-containing protein n=1 Tax=Paxillus rubicundulus Ve08.2h10 TaxID=930991 RepID=A0A0D0DZV4_9AGAM|nr:hypothetical protein PAXRUDRAFT_772670 [Paxillus rubicundulus Ve08.2h10]
MGPKHPKQGDSTRGCRNPEGTPPESGWPVDWWYHGAGGWTLGSISADNAFCSRSKRVVPTVDYRLAPEHPYPVAVEYDKGLSLLGIYPARIALGGSSAGRNLVAIVSSLLLPSLSCWHR